MKYTLRVATPEQYCYVEAVVEGTAKEAMAEYKKLNLLVHGGFGLDDKDWRRIVDKYMAGGSMTAEEGEQMSKEQAWFIKTFDNAVARQKHVNNKGRLHHSLEENNQLILWNIQNLKAYRESGSKEKTCDQEQKQN